MKRSPSLRLIVTLSLAALFLAACGAPSPTVVVATSTAQPAQPTATLTATPSPTATPPFEAQRIATQTLLLQLDKSSLTATSRLSPDGRGIAIVLFAVKQQSVVWNGIEQQPYDAIEASSLTFSPDSRQLAYLATKDKKQFLVVDGKAGKGYDPVFVLTESPVVFSADSQHVAYIAGAGEKKLVVLDGKEGKPYDQIVALAFNPANSSLAYWAKTGKKWAVVIDGKEGDSYDDIDGTYLYGGRVIGFSDDGKHIGYRVKVNGKVSLVIDGKAGTVYDEIGYYSFSPDGKGVAYSAKKGGKWVLVSSDNESQAYDAVGMPYFSADGKHTTYGVQVGNKWKIVIDEQLGAPYDELDDPTFSPDGQRTAFLAKVGDRWRVVLDGKEQKLYDNVLGDSMLFSADSRHLAYAAVQNGKGFIVVDGKEGPAYDDIGMPIFSPDGQHVAYGLQAGTKQFAAVDDKEGDAFDYVGKIYYDSNDRLHYLGVRGMRIYLVEEQFVHSPDGLAAANATATAAANANATQVAQAAPTSTARAEAAATAQAEMLATEAAAPTPTRYPTRTPTRASGPLATSVANSASVDLKTSQGWNVLMTDKFDDNHNGWTTGDGKSIANGKYVWDMNNRVNIYRGLPDIAPQSDFAASIDARLVSGSPDCGMGLTFRNSMDSGYMTDYVFYIHNDQRWGFDIIHSPDPGIAQEGTSTAVVPRALNRITVVAQGKRMSFFVNGKFVSQAEDTTLERGKIGAAVWILGPGACQVEFDNLEVRAPVVPTAANATATAQALQAKLASAKKWPVVFSETYDSNANGWPLVEPDPSMHASAVIEAGSYRWSAHPDDWMMLWETPAKRSASADAYISLDARRVTGPVDSAYGLVFREGESHTSFYAFRVNDEGKYQFLMAVPGESVTTDVVDWTDSPAIHRGGTNRLAVIAQGTRMILFVNDQYVGEVNNDRLKSGGIGVTFDVTYGEDTVFEFDNFEVRAP